MYPLEREDFFMPTIDPEKKKAKQARADAKRAGRTRNFATVVYPESAPADWMERLEQCHVPALVSPLHDKDTNPSGEPKKPHYHVMLMFESPTNYENKVAPIFAEIGAVGRETVNSARGYARYMCHLDNPEKAQYCPSEVRCMSGANFYAITNLPTDDLKMLGEIFSYIQQNEIYSLAELMDLTQVHHPEWFSMIAMSRCYVVDKFIKSLTWERETGHVRAADRQIVASDRNIETGDQDTGDVI